ncbi:MAG: hypothetical protein IH886_08965 [Nitrospinae bacterium]|nr:hypothetical protein [Nitrospinota bacterium]
MPHRSTVNITFIIFLLLFIWAGTTTALAEKGLPSSTSMMDQVKQLEKNIVLIQVHRYTPQRREPYITTQTGFIVAQKDSSAYIVTANPNEPRGLSDVMEDPIRIVYSKDQKIKYPAKVIWGSKEVFKTQMTKVVVLRSNLPRGYKWNKNYFNPIPLPELERAVSIVKRDVENSLEIIKTRVEGFDQTTLVFLKSNFPPRSDLFGAPVISQDGFLGVFLNQGNNNKYHVYPEFRIRKATQNYRFVGIAPEPRKKNTDPKPEQSTKTKPDVTKAPRITQKETPKSSSMKEPKDLPNQIIKDNNFTDGEGESITSHPKNWFEEWLVSLGISIESTFWSSLLKTAGILLGIAGLLWLLFLSYKQIMERKGIEKQKSQDESQTEGVATTDKPVDSCEDDRLNRLPLVKGLGLFLRHQNTQPPITLAITGEWGSGKSSIMNMLKEDMENAMYHPVWFNAWHHHSEEHLFGALLEAIRRQAIPPFWRATGMMFRLRLWSRRMARRHLVIYFFILSLVLWTVGRFTEGPFTMDYVYQALFQFTNLADSIRNSTMLIASFSLLGVSLDALTAFGLKPTQLFRSVNRAIDPTQIQVDPGLRYRINKALDDISQALGKRHLMIFIDDLDRCPADQVLKVLESVNFLSSSPRKCFIVLGMALNKVLPSISLEFNKIVDESMEEIAGEKPEKRQLRLKNERRTYAKHYLEKMINIEIHIPKVDQSKLDQLIQRDYKTEPPPKTYEEKVNFLTRIFDRWVFPGVLLIFASLTLYITGDYLVTFQEQNELNNKVDNQAKSGLQFVQSNREIEILQNKLKKAKKAVKINIPTLMNLQFQLEQAVEDKNFKLTHEIEALKSSEYQDAFKEFDLKNADRTLISDFNLGIAAILIALIAIILSLFKKAEVEDSNDFKKALDIWKEAINFTNNTPRHYKRAVNQLRFLDMRRKLSLNDGSPQNTFTTKIEEDGDQIVRFVVLKGFRELGLNSDDYIAIKTSSNLSSVQSKKEVKNVVENYLSSREIWKKKENQNKKLQISFLLGNVIFNHLQEFKNHLPTEDDAVTYDQLMDGVTLR